ncbi:hypothetical protein EIP86_011445 [Pleurotus ostreatoroseus]|nr:hypothetical protein EIP86_011445 [Pleurotus ostreatoroseus]
MPQLSTTSVLRNALEAFRGIVSQPMPTDPFESLQWDMAGAHVLFVHVLLAIYEQANQVSKEKTEAFVGYALVWYATLEHHHEYVPNLVWGVKMQIDGLLRYEETHYFDMLSHKYDLRTVISTEHEAFHGGLHALHDYLVSCLPSGTTYGFGDKVAPLHEQAVYDGEKLRSLVDTFAEPMADHFIQEVDYLDPTKMRAEGVTEHDVRHVSEESAKKIATLPLTTAVTFVVMASPRWTTFPPVPPLLKNLLVPYVFYYANRHLWQFIRQE